MADPSEAEFVARFTAHAIKIAGLAAFDDGTTVADYCAEVAPTYYRDEFYRSYGPEVCAESDVSYYWGEG